MPLERDPTYSERLKRARDWLQYLGECEAKAKGFPPDVRANIQLQCRENRKLVNQLLTALYAEANTDGVKP